MAEGDHAIIPERRRQPSLRSLETKVDLNHKLVMSRLDGLNLNGSAAALHLLGAHADELLELARVAPMLVAAVNRDNERAIALKYFKGLVNPFKPVGALIWIALTAAITAFIWNLVTGHPAL